MNIPIVGSTLIALLGRIIHDLGSFFDFYRNILSASSSEELRIKNWISFLKVSIVNKLGDIFRSAKNLVVRCAELYFPDDYPQLTYFRWIDFAEIVGDFDDVERFDALGC